MQVSLVSSLRVSPDVNFFNAGDYLGYTSQLKQSNILYLALSFFTLSLQYAGIVLMVMKKKRSWQLFLTADFLVLQP